jgi:putative Holliday junction resolvase
MTAGFPAAAIATPPANGAAATADCFVIPKDRIMMTGEGYVIIQGRSPASGPQQYEAGSFQRSSAVARRRVLALQTSGRNAPLLLRAAARRPERGQQCVLQRGGDFVMLAGAAAACYLSPMPALILPLIEVMPYLPIRGALIGTRLSAPRPSRRLERPRPAARHRRRDDCAQEFLRSMPRGFSCLRPNARPPPSCSAFPSTWMGPKVRARNRPRAFARNLARLTQLPIALWDERLSTAAVERELIAANVTRARRAKVIDQHAAVFILQGALDRLARGVMAH